jgi:hypothetical protein
MRPDDPGWLRRAAGVAAAALALAALAAAVARAQVSPGALAAAHADLDRGTLCFKCHARGGGMSARCLDCHSEIAAERRAASGYHGRLAADKECAGCHPDHAGREFALIRWDEGAAERFDHRRAGWPLTGKHAATACRDCHQPKFQRAPGARAIRLKDPARSWLGLDPDCAACHADPHMGDFGALCTKCHNTADWHRVDQRGFDHDRTRYPLRGKHAALACASCHDPKTAWGQKPPFERCGSCHQDAHGGQATLAGQPADCAACHSVAGFRPSSYTVADHERSAYPLHGKHAAVACGDCHKRGTAPGLGKAGVVLRPPHDRCAACHADAHGGQLAARPDGGACESCHAVAGFAPSSFTVAQHEALKLPLAGRHATIACAACHSAKRAGLPAPAGAARAGSAGFVFALAERQCADCHRDPHRGRYAAGGARPMKEGCAACHDAARFRPSRVDVALHKDYGFALEGAHRAVPCVDCHRELAAPPAASSLVAAKGPAPALPFDNPKRDCAACHKSPHGDQFAARADHGACDGCHGLESFRPASRFDHDRDAAFKLVGKHAGVACARCHPVEPVPGGTRVRYRGVPTRCESCHDQGGGRMGALVPARPGALAPHAAWEADHDRLRI